METKVIMAHMVKRALRRMVVLCGCILLHAGCDNARRLPDPLEAGWQGKAVCERLHDGERLRVLRCTFAPGIGHERHFHRPHFGYVVAGGRLQVTDGEGVREVDMPTGSSFTSEGVEWHEALNIGDTTAVFLIVEPR